MAIGYIELDDWIPFRKMFAYMDASDHYRADELLRKYKLKVKFKVNFFQFLKINICSLNSKQQV